MERIEIKATSRTPELVFDPTQRLFSLSGESYPEDPTKFYAEPVSRFREFLSQSHEGPITVLFKLTYFNSSSAKVIMDLFSELEESATGGNSIEVQWAHLADDDNMKELGEEFSEELVNTRFSLVEIE